MNSWQWDTNSILTLPSFGLMFIFLCHCRQFASDFSKKKSAPRLWVTKCNPGNFTTSCKLAFRNSVFKCRKSDHFCNDTYWFYSSSSVKCTVLTQQLGSGTGELSVVLYSRLSKLAKSWPVPTPCNKEHKLSLFYHLTDMACVIRMVQLLGTILKFTVQFSNFENRSLSFKPHWKLLSPAINTGV